MLEKCLKLRPSLDLLFTLHTLIEILTNRKQKLFLRIYCFPKCFDTIWRSGLWHKLLQYFINGKVFQVIFNM
jgi:hypothetical protein